MPAINPKNLIWARETAGLSLDDAAKLLGFKDSKRATAVEKLKLLEDGEKQPTRPQLKKMAGKYRRPLLVFYLNEPPHRGDRGQDFRTISREVSDDYSNYLDTLIRETKVRQNLVRSLIEDEEEPILDFINSATIDSKVEDVAQDIIKTIQFDIQRFRSARNYSKAFNYLRDCVEQARIFVLLASDLGSHHTSIPVDVFRGFVISDSLAPFIVINERDSKSAQSFTLIHEVAHLWLGVTGVSGTSFELEIESSGNRVAASILLDDSELLQLRVIRNLTFEESVSKISQFASDRNLSRAMIAYNLYSNGIINQGQWQSLRARFTEERIESQKEAKKKKEGRSGGPSYYVVKRFKLGKALIDLTNRSISEGTLSATKAGKILGVKPTNVELLLNPPHPGGDK